jgi:hypothetical protein
VCVVVAATRLGHNPLLANPQMKTAAAWAVAAVVVFVVSLMLPNNTSAG